MTNATPSSTRSRKLRNALLGSVFSLGIVAGTGALLADDHIALADPVHVDTAAPTDFSAIVEQVAPAVVSVQVKTEVAAVADRSGSSGRLRQPSPGRAGILPPLRNAGHARRQRQRRTVSRSIRAAA